MIFFLLIPLNLYSQYYTRDNFSLNGPVKRVSVACYNIELEEGIYTEGLPYGEQRKYHTDLNLHYLEFNDNGELSRSKLYYPRGFYGQFQWITPVFNLEESDFSEKKNYLSQFNRYKYIKLEDETRVIIKNSTGEISLLLDNKLNLLEDNYYTYIYRDSDSGSEIFKRRKKTLYDYRREETLLKEGYRVIYEYINNRFINSKKLVREIGSLYLSIFVSQSRIELIEETYNSELLTKRRYTYLNWGNRLNPWPELDFDESLNYDGFLNNIEREYESRNTEYEYSEGKLIRESTTDNRGRTLISKEYRYVEDQIKEILISKDDNLYFKEYIRDHYDNWTEKVVGQYIDNKRVPQKKYLKTIVYWK